VSTIAMPEPNADVIARKDAIVAALIEAVGADCVISDPAETKAYECDALAAYACPPLAAVLPRSTEGVAAALKVCHAHGVPVVPRGAGTSLAGGALPTADSVIIGTARLNRVLYIDLDNRVIRVETGITNLSVTGAVEADGFFYAPDPSSQLACAIAGNIAMNSGGAHCLKYGVTTNNLMGARVVMMDGEIVDIGGDHLDPGGYDWLGLICGSEGQLGIVTEATLRILAKPEGARPVLIGFNSPEVAGECVARIIKSGVLPVAIEYMDRLCIESTDKFAGAGYPDVEALLIVEVEGSDAEIDAQLKSVVDIANALDPVEVRESKTADEAARIWKGRKSAFGAMGQLADYMCLDGTVPVSQLPFVLGEIGRLSEKHGLRCANVFHAGDGNMHPLILFDANTPGDLERAEAFGAEILKLCVSVGGCLTGEHGVGIEKRDLMTSQFDPADLEAQLGVKDCFDPQWLLNPAKVFPLEVTAPRRDRRSCGADDLPLAS
jgi:glycolate oxidase